MEQSEVSKVSPQVCENLAHFAPDLYVWATQMCMAVLHPDIPGDRIPVVTELGMTLLAEIDKERVDSMLQEVSAAIAAKKKAAQESPLEKLDSSLHELMKVLKGCDGNCH